MKVLIESNSDGSWSMSHFDRQGKVVLTSAHALTVTQVAHKLQKSRRQIYRYLRTGKLQPLGKFFGEWVVQGADTMINDHIPLSWQVLFPEYDLASLDPKKHSAVIIPAILERGGISQTRWLIGRYGKSRLRKWLRTKGWQLSPRSSAFWAVVLGVPPALERPGIPGATHLARSIGFPR